MELELLIIPGILVFSYCAYSFVSKPQAAVFVIILTAVINAWFIKQPHINVGLHIYLFDPVFILIFIAALVRLIFFRQYHDSSLLWIGLGVIFLYGLGSGIIHYGTLAANEYRSFFYFWAGTLYFMSFQYSSQMLEKIQKNWFWVSLILLLIVYFRFVADVLHLPIAQTWVAADSTGVRFRVVSAADAYILAGVVVMSIVNYLLPGKIKSSKIIILLFIVAVLVLQHRSVWAFVLFGTASAAFLPGIKVTKLVQNVLLLSIVGAILLSPLLFYGFADIFIKTISKSAENATHLSTGTFGARVSGWYSMMDVWAKESFATQLIGEPMGGTYAGSKVMPHNYYVMMLLRSGIIGLISFIAFYFMVLSKLFLNIKKYSEDKLFYTMFFMLIIGELAFYIPYGAHEVDGIILGVAASLAKRKIAVGNIEENSIAKNQQYFLKIPVSNKLKNAAST